MAEVTITCPRCSESTLVDMEESISLQRCDHCGMFLYGADTGVKPDRVRRRRRRKGWRSLTRTVAGKERLQSVDPDETIYRRKGIPRWFFPTVLGCLLLVVWIVWYRVRTANQESSKHGEDLVLQTSLQNVPKDNPLGAEVKPVEEVDPGWAAAVRKVAVKFLAATTVEEMLPLTRNAAVQGPKMQKAYGKGTLPLGPGGVLDLLYAPEMPGQQIAMLFFRNRQETLQGIVVVDTGKEILVDWPSVSGCGDMAIPEFLDKKPTAPTLIFVVARRDDYYNFQFADRKAYQSLRLTTFPENEVFYGYVQRDSPLFDKVKSLPEQGYNVAPEEQPKGQPLAVKASFPQQATSEKQVEIVEILGNGWFIP